MGASAFEVRDTRMGVNYGLNRVRFPAPVPSGSRLRGRFKLLSYEPIEGGAQLTVEVTMEREGSRQAGLRRRVASARRYDLPDRSSLADEGAMKVCWSTTTR